MQCSNGLQPGGAMAKTAKSNVPHDRGTLLFYGCAGVFSKIRPPGRMVRCSLLVFVRRAGMQLRLTSNVAFVALGPISTDNH